MMPVNREDAAVAVDAGGAGVAGAAAARPLRELMDDRLLERSRDQAGGLRLTGEGSMLGELVKAVLERALEAELTAHLGYGRHETLGQSEASCRGLRGAPPGGGMHASLTRWPGLPVRSRTPDTRERGGSRKCPIRRR